MVIQLSFMGSLVTKKYVLTLHLYRYNSTGLDPWEGGGAGPGAAQRMTVDQIRADQQAMIDDQDRGLDELSKALRRQQQMGLDMQDEIQEHNGMIYFCSLAPRPLQLLGY